MDLGELARSILADRDARQAGDSARSLSTLTIAQAYELQEAVSILREKRGENVIGYKIGCTSRAIQEQLGVRQPIFGRLFDTGRIRSGSWLSSSHYLNLAVEGELAIRLARDLPRPPYSEEQCAAAVESVFPVIELHDYMLRCDPPCAAELIARNGMHAGFVAEDPLPDQFGPEQTIQEIAVKLNERVVGSTTEPWAMRSAGAAIRWLSETLGELALPLERGQVILTGSVMRLFSVGQGTEVTVEAPPLGKCTIAIGE